MAKQVQTRRTGNINHTYNKSGSRSSNKNIKSNSQNSNESKKKRVNPKLKKIINQISIGTIFLLGLVIFYLIYKILVLNMIPMKYFLIILIILFIILSIMSLLLINKKIKWKIKIGGIVFSLIISFIMFLGARYIEDTVRFLKRITENNKETEIYYLITLNTSEIDGLSDIDSNIGYVSKVGNSNEAIDELNKTKEFKYAEYNQVSALTDDLINKKIDVILLADYYKQMIDEEQKDISKQFKVIYMVHIERDSCAKSKQVDVTKDIFSIYISGIDTFGEIGTVSRSDVNIVATINPNTKQILLTTIPRDFYIKLHKYNEMDKLTHSGVLGIDVSVATIEDFLDIDINYYVKVNFSTVVDVVDALGGINVYSGAAFKTTSWGFKFKKGYNYLNGEEALAFARERKAFLDGDRQRGKNQQAIIKAIINKAISPSIISNYSNLLKSLSGTFQTNMSVSEIQKLAKFQIDKMPSWEILTISLNGADSKNYTYLYGDDTLLYVMEPYKETVEYAKVKLKDMLSGKVISVKDEETSGVYEESKPHTQPVKPKPNDEDTENNNQDENKKPIIPDNSTDKIDDDENNNEDNDNNDKVDDTDNDNNDNLQDNNEDNDINQDNDDTNQGNDDSIDEDIEIDS